MPPLKAEQEKLWVNGLLTARSVLLRNSFNPGLALRLCSFHFLWQHGKNVILFVFTDKLMYEGLASSHLLNLPKMISLQILLSVNYTPWSKKRRKGKMSCISPSEERDVFERQQPISGSGTCWLVSNSGMSQKLTMESCGKFEAPSKHPAAETDSMMLF